MVSKEDRDRVKTLVLEAFRSAPEPPEVAAHNCQECENLRQAFKGYDWKELSSDLLADHAWDLPLMTPEAFRYFLPAWIFATLNEWTDPYSSYVFLPTIYELVPTQRHNDRFHERYIFSKNQKKAITEFLKLIRQEALFHDFHNEADAGLKMYS